MLPKCACSGALGSSRIWIVVDGPRLGLLHDRNAQATFLSGVISQACTVLVSCAVGLPHWLSQLLSSVLPLGSRWTVCRPVTLYSGRSSTGINSHTVSPPGLISRTRPLPLTSVLPLGKRTAYHGATGNSADQRILPDSS